MVELFEHPFEGCKEVSYFGLRPLYYKEGVVKTDIGDLPIVVGVEDYMKYLFLGNVDFGIYGYYTGLTALNILHGTTQVPILQEFKSNKTDKIIEYGITNGIRFKVYPSSVIVTEDNFRYLQVLDILEDWFDYFEDDRNECIRYAITRQNLKLDIFREYFKYYSDYVRRFIYELFTRE